MVVFLTCKNEEDPIENEGARVLTRLYVVFSRHSRAAYSEVRGGILPKFELIKALMVSTTMLPARMKKNQSKMKALEC